MCTEHLNVHNIEVTDETKEQRKAALNHKELMLRNSKNLKNKKFEPLIPSSHTLAAQIITLDEKNTENVKIHAKLHLNTLNTVNLLHKKTTNDETKIPTWLGQCDNINLLYCSPSDMIRNGNVGNCWDGKEHGEKGMQPVKISLLQRRKILRLK